MSQKRLRTEDSVTRRFARMGKRGLALVVFGLLLVGTALPPVASAQTPWQPTHQLIRPMDGQGDSPLVP